MNRKSVTRGLLFLFTGLLVIGSCCAALSESYSAATMRLLRYEGTVEIEDAAGKARFVLENARFSSGESLRTGEDALASVGLDDSKIVTVDANSRVTFTRQGNQMQLKLTQGTLLLDVKEKLDENESLDIQTSTMTVGIRGTIVFARQLPSGDEMIGILEGKAEVRVDEAANGENKRQVQLTAGQKISLSRDSEGKMTEAVSGLTGEDIAGFVREQVESDPELSNRINQVCSVLDPYAADGDWTYDQMVTLIAQSASKLYDGQPLTRRTDVLVEGLPKGFTIRVSAGGSQTDAGRGENPISDCTIFNSRGEDVTRHFTRIKKVAGILTVDPVPVTVWTGSAEKRYDGSPLVNEKAELRTVPRQEGAPAWRNTSYASTASEGETLYGVCGVVWVHGTNPLTGETSEIQLYAGKKLTVVLHNEQGKQKTTLEYRVETMTEQQIPEELLQLYADNPALLKQACADAGWDLKTVNKRIKALGTREKTVKQSSGLAVEAAKAEKLIIDSSNVHIHVDTDETDYDGQTLGTEEIRYVPIKIDSAVKVTATGSQTRVGTSPNTYEIKWGKVNPENYLLSEELGTLRVLAAPKKEYTQAVAIQAPSAEKTYDGKPLKAGKATATGLPQGFTFEAEVSGSRTNAGTGKSSIASYKIYDKLGNNVTAYFTNLTIRDGALTVKPAELTVTTGSASKRYDGKPLKKAKATIKGLVAGETATAAATGSITDAGTAKNTVSIQWGTAQKGNYTVKKVLGTLTVKPARLTVTTASAQKTFDGKALTQKEVTVKGLVNGETIRVTANGTLTDVGKVRNTCSIQWETAKKKNYTVTQKLGTLQVKKNASLIIITSGDGSMRYKPYDCIVKNSNFTVEGLPSGFSVTADITGEQSWEVGSSPNTIASYAILNDAGEDKTANFSNVKLVEGTLTVQKAILQIWSDDVTKEYDGNAAASTIHWTGIYGMNNAQYGVSITHAVYQTDVGSAYDDFNVYWNYPELEALYEIQKEPGLLTVRPRTITVTTGSDSKPYDGTPLTNAEATVTGAVAWQSITVTATGEQTEVGSSKNTYAINWGNANRNNYTVVEELGTLTVE